MSDHSSSHGFATKAIHAGQRADQTSGAVIIPISLSTTFQQTSPGVHTGFEYARTGNPTRNAFEDCVAALENGTWGLAFSSGLGATASITAMFQQGDEIICMDDVYGGTYRYFTKISSHQGMSYKFVDLTNPSNLEAAISEKTKMVWLETPTNPTLKISDIRAIAEVTRSRGVLLAVDNTFMSPYFQRPLDLGADLVVHSVTKYLNGHSDVVMGVVCGKDPELQKRLKFIQNGMGAIPSPFDSWLALRGLKTLPLRMQQHAKSAQAVAEFLEGHPKVEKITYPGLPSHPQHHLAKTQQHGFGGMITFWLKGGEAESRRFLENVKIFALAESLGGVESLIEHPAIMTHASVPSEERKKLGISDNMVRLSVGIETLDDLIRDIQNALEFV
jgi:cystathionine gamma-lyase